MKIVKQIFQILWIENDCTSGHLLWSDKFQEAGFLIRKAITYNGCTVSHLYFCYICGYRFPINTWMGHQSKYYLWPRVLQWSVILPMYTLRTSGGDQAQSWGGRIFTFSNMIPRHFTEEPIHQPASVLKCALIGAEMFCHPPPSPPPPPNSKVPPQ